MFLDLRSEKRRAFKSAQDRLDGGDEDVLHLVALDLRRCIEAIVYERLWTRKEWLPAEIARTWQQPRAFEALLAIDPDAEHSATLAVAPEATFGVMAPPEAFTSLGVETRPRLKWLKDNYHKLGSFLHVKSPFVPVKEQRSSERIEYFRKLLHELKALVESDLTFSVAYVVKFTCHWCKETITVNALALDGDQTEAQCLRCLGTVSIKRDGEEFIAYPQITWANCPECKTEIELRSHKLTDGYQFTCVCGSRFEVSQAWQFAKVEAVSHT